MQPPNPRPSKKAALDFAKRWTPLYAEVFQELKDDGGRIQIRTRAAQIRQNVGNYVELYDDERKLGVALLMGLIGEDGFEELKQESASWSEEESNGFVEFLTSPEGEKEITDAVAIPETEEEWQHQEQALEGIAEDERGALARQGAFFWAGVFAHIFNTLSLMVHGAKLTSLVPLALNGDDEAFLKAVQIDRMLLTRHPYFSLRKQRAQELGETEFLRALAYRECNPNLRGKIRYPALYMLFGVLDSLQWLDDLKHEEILDLCDEIGLDRYQNRIEDVNCLTKRLIEYRQFQKTNGVSMH